MGSESISDDRNTEVREKAGRNPVDIFCSDLRNSQSDAETDEYVEAASFMALFHNILLRGLNTIYLQAPFVKDVDKKDFVGYALCWYDAINGADYTLRSRLSLTISSTSYWRREGVLSMD
jgi:hypothetical protein